MTTVSQAVEQKNTGPVAIMWAKRNHFAAVLPQHLDIEAFLGTAAGALYGSKDLMLAASTSPDSLITALMRCAALGHQPGTEEFYLVPRKIKGRPTVMGLEGYRGIVERMYRSGAVSSVVVREVCASDRFRYVEGETPKPVHHIGGEGETGADFFGVKGSHDRGEMVGVYAYAVLKDGATSRVVLLSRDDVMAAAGQCGERQMQRGLAARRGDARDTAFQGGDALFQRGDGGIGGRGAGRDVQRQRGEAGIPWTAHGVHPENEDGAC